jgi:acetolactate synthase-1/2/3 large subunit
VQELSTQVRHNITQVTVVFNDNAFGNVKRIQQQAFNGRTIASTLLNPDFAKLAELYGIRGMRAEGGPESFKSALHEAMKLDEPVVIEVPVGEMPSVWSIVRRGTRTEFPQTVGAVKRD